MCNEWECKSLQATPPEAERSHAGPLQAKCPKAIQPQTKRPRARPLQIPGAPMSVRGRRPIRVVPEPPRAEIGPFRARHLTLAERAVQSEYGRATVTVDDSESPLAWLARRRGRGGHALIAQHQLQAGERLRSDFTLAHLMPRTTASWSSPI